MSYEEWLKKLARKDTGGGGLAGRGCKTAVLLSWGAAPTFLHAALEAQQRCEVQNQDGLWLSRWSLFSPYSPLLPFTTHPLWGPGSSRWLPLSYQTCSGRKVLRKRRWCGWNGGSKRGAGWSAGQDIAGLPSAVRWAAYLLLLAWAKWDGKWENPYDTRSQSSSTHSH